MKNYLKSIGLFIGYIVRLNLILLELIICQRWIISKSWVNSHYQGAWTDSHDHGNAHLVCSVYIQQPENGGNLEFENRDRTLFAGYPRFPQNKSKLHNYYTEVEVKQGDVVFFPGWLSHRSQPNRSLQRRIVMGMNWHCSFERPPQTDNRHIEKNV